MENVDNFKRMFISPDLTRRQQKVDKRTELKKFRKHGESTAKIKYGKIVKKRQREGCSAVRDSTVQLDTSTNRIDCVHALTQSTAHALKCLFVNARGLISKIYILKTHIYEMGLDITGIAETFLCDDVMQAEISI